MLRAQALYYMILLNAFHRHEWPDHVCRGWSSFALRGMKYFPMVLKNPGVMVLVELSKAQLVRVPVSRMF